MIEGLYLVGSVALGDFQPGRSDIDFIALIPRRLSPAALRAVEAVHRQLAMEAGAVFDGFYIDRPSLGRPPDPNRVLPYELMGRFHRRSACFEANPVTWRIWHDHAVVVRGPAPATLDLCIDPTALARFEQENLAGYWTDWVVRHWAGPADAGVAASGVLGVLRLAHVLTTGQVPSKTAAGRWALQRFASSWHPIIAGALATHHGDSGSLPLDRYQAALDFVAFVIAETRSDHPLR